MSDKVERNKQVTLDTTDFFVDEKGNVVITNAAISEALRGVEVSPEEGSERAAIIVGMVKPD